MRYEEVKKYCEESQSQCRKDRYKIMENYFNIDGKVIKDIISFDRYLRDILEVDPIGESLEKEWHKPKTMWDEEYRMDKQLEKDRLKYF